MPMLGSPSCLASRITRNKRLEALVSVVAIGRDGGCRRRAQRARCIGTTVVAAVVVVVVVVAAAVIAAAVVVVMIIMMLVVMLAGRHPVVVHLERPALEHFAVKQINGLAGRVFVLERDQCKPQTVAHVVGLDLDVRHGPAGAQMRLELVPGGCKRNVAHKQPLLVYRHVREVHHPRLVPAAVVAVVPRVAAVAAKPPHSRHVAVRHKAGVETHAEHGRCLGPVRRDGRHVVRHGGVSKGGGAGGGDRVGRGRCGLGRRGIGGRGGGCKIGLGHRGRAGVEGHVLRHVLRRQVLWGASARVMLRRLGVDSSSVLIVRQSSVHAHGDVMRVVMQAHLHLVVHHGLVLEHHGLLGRQGRLGGQHVAVHVVALQLGREFCRHLGGFHLDVGDAGHHDAHHAPAGEHVVDDVFDASPGGVLGELC